MADESENTDADRDREKDLRPAGENGGGNGNPPTPENGAAGDTPPIEDTREYREVLAAASGGGGNRGGGRGPGGGNRGGGNRGGGRGPGGGGPSWRSRDLTTGSIPKNLFSMAWPQSVESVLRVVMQILDLVWAGFLGTPHIAGVGVAQQYTQTVWTARQGIDTAQRAMVSRAIGMHNVPLAQLTVYQAATVTAIFWVIIASIGIIFTEPLLRLLAVPDNVVDKAMPYMRVQFAGQGFMGFQQILAHALLAAGDPITPMRASVVSRVVHGVVSPFLVFGLLGAPEIGIAGAPLAAATGNCLALIIVGRALFTGRTSLHLKWSEFRIDRRLIWEILRIGIPAAVNGAERSIAQLLLVRFVTPFGENALAVYALSRRVEMFANLGSMGFGQASGIIVGQNLGAGKPGRGKQTILWALGYVLTLKTTFTVLLFLFPSVFLSAFTRDPELLELGSTWVRIGCVGFVALGFNNVFQQSFMTAGATTWPMLVTLIALWFIELPLAYILSWPLGMDELGIAWAISIAALVRPVLHVPYFLSNRWMRARVFSGMDVDTILDPQAELAVGS